MIAVVEKLHPTAIDETGNRYGRWTVLGYAGLIGSGGLGGRRRTQWRCRCDCGKEKIIRGGVLRAGRSKSCGCFRKEVIGDRTRLPRGEAAFNLVYCSVKRGAKSRNYVFELTKKQVRDIVVQNCHYCGSPPQQKMQSHGINGDFLYSGIDRTNNDLGYFEGNIVPCCGICNYMKRTMSVEQFKDHIIKIYKHFVERDA